MVLTVYLEGVHVGHQEMNEAIPEPFFARLPHADEAGAGGFQVADREIAGRVESGLVSFNRGPNRRLGLDDRCCRRAGRMGVDDRRQRSDVGPELHWLSFAQVRHHMLLDS